MKKMLLLVLAVLLLLMPGTASAISDHTVTFAPDGKSFTLTLIESDYLSIILITFCDGTSHAYEFQGSLPAFVSWTSPQFDKPISHLEFYFRIGPIVDASRNCETAGAEPLFIIWLLTRGDEGCILLSETHPSVERQKALCFPATDPDWVADNAPCADYVYDNDTWSCDAFGFPRLPLHDENGPDLWEVWQRHAARE
jgi:hypothetical protein